MEITVRDIALLAPPRLLRPREWCWAECRTGIGACQAAAVRIGLCAECYKDIFGREPDAETKDAESNPGPDEV